MSFHVNPGPNATYASSQTQTVADAAQGQAVTFDTIIAQHGIDLPLTGGVGTKITLKQPGQYMFAVSAICHTTAGSNKAVYIWFKYNGNDVPDSNTLVNIASGNEQVLAVTTIYPCVTVDDYYEIYMAGDTTNCQIKAFPAVVAPSTPVMPAIPSIILTVNQVV